MSRTVVKVGENFKAFIKKVTLSREIDLPIEVYPDGKIEVKRKDIAMKVVGTYTNVSVLEGEIDDKLILGFPNAKAIINYLTVLGESLLVKKEGDAVECVHLLPTDEEKSVSFSAVLSIFAQPDVSPPKLENFLFDFDITEKVREIFEVVKIIKSDTCGILITEDGQVSFRVGSDVEDRGSVFLGELESKPELQGKFVKEVSNGYFVSFRQLDIADTLSVVDKSSNNRIRMRMKKNGGFFISEEGDDLTVHYGFVPYS
jgi:uncharacterized cupredoxin-like copper-binding protein